MEQVVVNKEEEITVIPDDDVGAIANEFLTEYLKCKSTFEYFCAKYILIEIPGKDAFLKPYKK